MKKIIISFVIFFITFASYSSNIEFFPIRHASFVITSEDLTIYVDPVGNIDKFKEFKYPDIILITHAHHDHLSKKLIACFKNDYKLIAPEIVTSELGFGNSINNGDILNVLDVKIEAIPMYNLSKDKINFHKKGIGNGYVLTLKGERIYIAGDTEDIPEMRQLKDIDYAFVCMNLPYTMTVDQAASAVLNFKPKKVYPYHFVGKNGESDLDRFKKLVSKDENIEVVILDWYKD